MYKKNLVKTAMLASIISISMSGCGGCGKEEVVSALDTAQEVVASVEEKTVEKAVEDNAIASVDKVEKEDKAPASSESGAKSVEAPDQKNENTGRQVDAPEKSADAMTEAEVWSYLDSTPPEKWDVDVVCEALILDTNGEWDVPDAFIDVIVPNSEEDKKLAAAYDQHTQNWLNNYHEPGAEELYNQIIAEQNGEYNGPHPVGERNVQYPTVTIDTTITTNTRGNIS